MSSFARYQRRLRYRLIRTCLSIRRLLALCLIGVLSLVILIVAALNYWQFSLQNRQVTELRLMIRQQPESALSSTLAHETTSLYKLNRYLFMRNLGILIIIYLMMAVALLLVIRYGLRSLKRIAREVSCREPDNLQAIAFKEAPIEVRPLLKELNKLFRKVNDTIEREKRFTADAAHELRTPLAALKTQVEVARRQNDAELRATILKNIISGANRCAHVIDQLLTLSRLEPQASLHQVSQVDLNQTANEMVADLAPAAIEKNIDISLHAPDRPLVILGNVTSMQILLRNLIDNAIRYTPESGQVTVTLQETAQHVCLQVIDTGPGIAAHLRQRIFERFFRELGNKCEGSGLGLSIVQQIVRLHHASIQAKPPASGTGLEMCVTFPRVN